MKTFNFSSTIGLTRYQVYWAVSGIIILALLAYLMPVALLGETTHVWGSSVPSQLQSITLRSMLVALLSAGLCICCGFFYALKLRKIELSSTQGKWFSLLIVPFLLGNVSVAFIFKMLLLNNEIKSIAFTSPWIIFGILIVIQIWQFGSLFAYLLWISLKSISNEQLVFAEVSALTSYEKVRDLYLPHTKNLLILLFLIGFVFSFYEDIKLTLIFSASPGTDSELISHWLYRQFRSDLLINFNFAAVKVASYSFLYILPIAFVGFLLFSGLLTKGITVFSRSRKKIILPEIIPDNKKLKEQKAGRKMPLILLVLLAPVIYLIATQSINYQNSVVVLWEPFYLTLLASLIACTLSIILSVALRLAGPVTMGTFNKTSILILALLYTIRLTPPIVLLIAGFKWLNIVNLSHQSAISLFWIIGHCMLSLPLLGSFLFVTHFRVHKKELEYLSIFNIPERSKFYWNFWRRFRGDYLLTFLFATTIIWNEGIINRVFSDSIPSFVSILLRTISSRQADYSEAMTFLFVSILLAALCLFLWTQSLSKAQRN